MQQHIDPTHQTVEKNREIIALAEEIIADRPRFADTCRGRKLATLFYEPSTRTRLSFTAAMMELGGQVIGFSDAASSSVTKGETVADTVRVIRCFADIIAMRHHKEGAPLVASRYAGIPVINAGDGSHSHPTQTLTDLLTIKREKGRLDRLTVGFCGDLKFGRTVHSLIRALARYEGIRVVLIAPEELRLPDYMLQQMQEFTGITFREARTLEEAMPELDVLYMTRVQKERFLDEEEFERVRDSFVLDAAKLRTARPDMIVLHPLPRVNEIAPEVDSDPRAAYFRQVENGKFVRMALILKLLSWAAEPAAEPAASSDAATRSHTSAAATHPEGAETACGANAAAGAACKVMPGTASPDAGTDAAPDADTVSDAACGLTHAAITAPDGTPHRCPNPRCISATEPVEPLFRATGDGLRCAYCETRVR